MPATMRIQNFSEQFGIDILNKILEGKFITPVYQPIVSLADGEVFGYEALSRISNKELEINIEEMFKISDRTNRASELEALCREKVFENAKNMNTEKKLFLNVNPNVIHDAKFKEEFTKSCLEKYGLNFQNIVLEFTERTAVINKEVFLNSIEHYRNQNYEIAIDNAGAGHSELNMINEVNPDIIKLDMNLIRNIDKKEIKQLLCRAIVDFGKNLGIKVIAKGIETEGEFLMLIRLGVDYGQGYFLGIPKKSFADIAPEKIEFIKKYNEKKNTENFKRSIYPVVGHLSKSGFCFSPDEKVEEVYEKLRLNPIITEFTIVNENNMPIGFMTREAIYEILGGRFGFNLHSKVKISQIANNHFLKVNHNMPVDQVSKLAMQRAFERLYNPIVVEKDGKYFGIVTIKDLLDTCTQIELDAERAKKERIDAELNVATHIQTSMLPHTFPAFPHRAEFDIYATMLPAKEVGGDFYDFFLLDDNTLAVVIADVSGKGVPAALFMVIAKTLIKSNALYGKNPKDVFEAVNNILCENNEENMFVTAFLGYLDIPSGKFTFANAGHNPPLLRSGKQFDWLKTKPGFILACMENMLYKQYEVFLQPDDELFLYTDGVTEAMNNERELFSDPRLLETANNYLDLPLKEFTEKLKGEIYKFADGAEQSDDITTLALRYKGVESNTKGGPNGSNN